MTLPRINLKPLHAVAGSMRELAPFVTNALLLPGGSVIALSMLAVRLTEVARKLK